MKKIIIFIFTCLFLSEIVFAADIQFLTHNSGYQTIVDNKGELRGIKHGGKRAFYVEIIHEMMTIMNVSKEIKQYPFTRAMLMVTKNDDYALFNVSRTPEREETVKWLGPLLKEIAYFYEMKNTPTDIKTFEDAKKVHSIGVMRGSTHESILLDNNFENTISGDDYKQLFFLLKKGRINLTITTSVSIFEKLKEADISPEEINQTPVIVPNSGAGGFLVFSKNISDEIIHQW